MRSSLCGLHLPSFGYGVVFDRFLPFDEWALSMKYTSEMISYRFARFRAFHLRSQKAENFLIAAWTFVNPRVIGE